MEAGSAGERRHGGVRRPWQTHGSEEEDLGGSAGVAWKRRKGILTETRRCEDKIGDSAQSTVHRPPTADAAHSVFPCFCTLLQRSGLLHPSLHTLTHNSSTIRAPQASGCPPRVPDPLSPACDLHSPYRQRSPPSLLHHGHELSPLLEWCTYLRML